MADHGILTLKQQFPLALDTLIVQSNTIYRYLFSVAPLCSFNETTFSEVSTLLVNRKTLLWLPNICHIAALGVEQCC